MDPVIHALALTVLGMGLVFLALAILLGSMVALTRLFPERESGLGMAAAESTEQAPSPQPSGIELTAIGAALAIWRGEPGGHGFDPQLGATLAASPSPWGVAALGGQRGPP
jgi:Na+-transporting methylmalonyl-CoA/oxaloacetate decarboxylase gamma subunit